MANCNRVSIPIIPYGLRQEETVVQIAAALDNVDCLINDVFQKFDENISKYRKYLSSLQKRSDEIAAKVEKLAGMNDVATTVCSHYKFPTDQQNSFDTLFNFTLKPLDKKPSVSIEGRFQHVKYNNTLNKLRFFHVKSEPKLDEQELILERGLGNIPSDIEHISSLLLFNTAENVYQKYVQVDPLAIHSEPKFPREEIKKKDDIAAAPMSIVNDQVFQNEEYFKSFYTPAYEEVPSINVPTDLPDLPGIAGNLKFNLNTPVSIITPSTPLPKRIIIKQAEEISSIDLPEPSSKLLELPKTETPDTTTTEMKSEPKESVTRPPPPPPPPLPNDITIPPPPPPPIKSMDNLPNIETEVSAPKMPENPHATLMEAIRNAGGKEKAKLRPVSANPSTSENVDSNTFLGELYNTLAMRRKGISGHKNKDVHIMDRVSALITASSDSSESDNNGGNISDWDE